MEIWKNINNYEELYQISNLGRVKSLRFGEKIMKPYSKKYSYIDLRDNRGFTNRFKIHRLVAQYFIENPENKPFVNHKDGNGLNNEVSNLEWCTQKENIYHSKKVTGNGTVISKQKLLKLYEENMDISLKQFVGLIIKNMN